MKLLSKLGVLGSCWQSPSPTVSSFEQENAATSLNPQPKRRRPEGSSTHWRPALTAISEDNSVVVCSGDERKTKTKTKLVEKERRAKAIRVRVKPRYSDDSSW
ncbi:hypothetical protein QQ045_010507 [Rhodiola kirilowii]